MCRDGVVACKLPQLNISSPEIMKFIHDVPSLSCGSEDWVVVEGPRLVISNKAKTKHGQIKCIFSGKLKRTFLKYAYYMGEDIIISSS